MKKILTAALLAASVLVLAPACKKKDEGGQAADKTEAAKPAGGDMKAPEAKPAAGGGAVANAADYEAKATDLMNKFVALFAADGNDCDKLAADISKFMDDNKPTFDAVTTFEKANPDAKKAFDQKSEAMQKDFEAKAGPAMDKCKDNQKLKDAMAKMPE